MTREEATKKIKKVIEESVIFEDELEAFDMAIKALSSSENPNTCGDAISRQAVEDKLLKLCNELEGIFANIRMQNQDESVCGLCEYDCPTPYECPGFDIEDCFKLADEIRHKWQSTKDLPSVNPQEPKTDVLDKIRAEILNFKEKCNASDYLRCGILEIIDKYKAESEDKE